MSEARAQSQMFKVVVNEDKMYSLWPVNRELPPGWEDAGKSGSTAWLTLKRSGPTCARFLSLRKE